VIVVDTSVAMKWFVEEEGSDAAVSLAAQETLIAPSLLRIEAGNVFFKLVVLRKLWVVEAALAAQAELDTFITEWVNAESLSADALAIACEIEHPVYDCYYLALARSRGIKLATADKRLIGQCRSKGWGAMIDAW